MVMKIAVGFQASLHIGIQPVILHSLKFSLTSISKRGFISLIHYLDWRTFLMEKTDSQEMEMFRKHERTGRPLAEMQFIEKLEISLGRRIRPKKPRRKSKIGAK